MRSLDSRLEAVTPRLPLILTMFGALAATLFIGMEIGKGGFAIVYLLVTATLGIIFLLTLGSRYWLLIPFSLSFTAPVIPLGGRALELPELTIMVCAVLFLMRVALRTQEIRLFRRDHLPFLLYAAWAAFIYLNHPTGFSGFGASEGGARFYLKIFMALAAFLIVANQNITERDCKWILIVTVVGVALDSLKMLLFYHILGYSIGGFEDPLGYYTWQQQLSSVPLAIVLILFSRYPASEIFTLSKSWRAFLFTACAPVILMSGKRSAAMCLVLYPVIAAWVRKEYRYVFLSFGAALVVGVVLVAGQGSLFHLPLTAQRTLSWLPGRWDPDFANMEGGTDEFRASLRQLAREKIQRNPWIGTGYEVNAAEMQRLSLTMANKSDAGILQMALGSSWHNRWLGYAADFGIPASIILGIIYLFVIYRSHWIFRRLPNGSFAQSVVMYVLIITVVDVVFSNVSGHSGNDAFTRWWMYGVLVAIARPLEQERAPLPLDDSRRRKPDSWLEPAHATR